MRQNDTMTDRQVIGQTKSIRAFWIVYCLDKWNKITWQRQMKWNYLARRNLIVTIY